ncbi:endonuclease V [Halovenus sp. HT40]|jgi:deoxyribonuclease V|uniref:endonuclease V n=1 Tax=Halovenus sp. HT40 TaxID=3126691 RepID=UPI00300EA443
MEPVRPEFAPDPSLSREEMEILQREIAETATFSDDLAIDPLDPHTLVAGVDQGFSDDMATSAIVVTRGESVIERVHARVETEIPYIPGLLSFREGGAILAAFEKLETDPDIVLFDGSGRIHFREAGLATHIGVMLDVPAIGVAKNLLCGRPTESLADPLPEGTRIPIEADEEVTAPIGTVIGHAFQSRQYDSGNQYINPLYVSPGHRVSAETATDIVANCSAGYKLPEPTRLADSYAADVS